jgi:membrane protease YdiL (CAAX protease family)
MQVRLNWFLFACAGEAALGLLAVALGYALHQSPTTRLHWRFADAAIGLAASIPPLLWFVSMWKLEPALLRDIRLVLEQTVRPLFASWSIFQLAVISALAGVGEELLFRGLIQERLSTVIGPVSALVVSSLLFGCAHPITWNYAWVTALIGVYLGGLMMATGNLLCPIVTHAAYDFLALVYFLRIRRGR